MTDILYQISRQLNLGAVCEPPRQLTGGFLHRMYSLSTGCGKFAVKLLNPHIMARPTAMENFRRAEALESLLEKTPLPILPALIFGARKMQELDGQYYYVYNWFNGHALVSDEITPAHCRTIGAILAQLHAVDLRREPFEAELLSFDWDFFIQHLLAKKPELGHLLKEHRNLLSETQSRANTASKELRPLTAICHNDMDSKNVLWHDGSCRIIDLECLGWSHPHLEFYETALCWSGIEEGRIDPERFHAFIRAYSESGGRLPADLRTVHDANAGRLGWLEYNLRRALGMDCASDEIAIGESEVRKTLAQLECCARVREQIL